MSSARLDVWAPAQIVAYAKAGLRPKAMAGKVTKTDGKIPRLRSVQKTIAKTPECAPASDGETQVYSFYVAFFFPANIPGSATPVPDPLRKGALNTLFVKAGGGPQ